jgi:hypothetical protein
VTEAVRLLAEAEAAGVSVQIEPAGSLYLTADVAPPEPLLAGLRTHRDAIVGLLRGDRCKFCSEPIDWTRPGGLVFGDGRGAHVRCYEAHETERQAAARERQQPKEQAA